MKKHHQYKVHVMTTMCAREVFPVVDERKKDRSASCRASRPHWALVEAICVYSNHAMYL